MNAINCSPPVKYEQCKNSFLLLKKFKNTESAQLWAPPGMEPRHDERGNNGAAVSGRYPPDVQELVLKQQQVGHLERWGSCGGIDC